MTDGLIDASEIGESIGSALSPSPASVEMVVFWEGEPMDMYRIIDHSYSIKFVRVGATTSRIIIYTLY